MLFSIIIPVLNEEKYINQCLASLMHIDVPLKNVEIILVDNGSVDKTLEIARQYEKVRILQIPDVNISAMRNFGARKATGQFFAFLDGDCKVPENWPGSCLEHLRNKNIAVVGADPIVPSNSSWVARTWAINFPNSTNLLEVPWVASHNLIVKKEVFKEINGFREDLSVSEDVDFCDRIRQKKYKIISDPKASVVHLKNPETIKDFFWKEVWRGKCQTILFLNNFPHIKGSKSFFYGILMLFFSICFFAGIIFFSLTGEILFFLLPALLMLAGPFFLTITFAARRKRFNYFGQSLLLFFIYGIARGIASVNPRNWKSMPMK